MRPNYTTIVTPIVAGREGLLKQYLRDHAEPRPGSLCEDFLRCRSLFPFDKIKCLHFCSFSVLDEDGEFGPSLILEATFDGPRADVLRELWRVAPAGMHAVYAHCVGYPATGLAVPELIEEYLVRHDVGADTFFSGCPGRCVAQIQGESRVRSEIVAFLSSRQAADAPPTKLAALQQAMQRDVIRSRPENRWAEQPAVTPWEVTNRTWVVRAVIVAATAGVCALGALAVRIMFGKGPLALQSWIDGLFSQMWQAGVRVARAEYPGLEWLAGPTRELQLPVLYAVLALAVLWIVVRVWELIFRTWTVNPHRQYFVWRLLLHIMVILKYAILVSMVAIVVLGLVTDRTAPALETAPSQVKDLVLKLDRSLARQYPSDARESSVETAAPDPALFASIVLLLGVGLLWVLLQHWATSLKLAVQFQELTPTNENVRRFLLDIATLARVVAAVFAVLILARHIPADVAATFADGARPWVYGLLVLATYALAGILIVYAVGLALLFIVKALEMMERRRFENAAALVTEPLDNAHSYAREEGGINRHQNHLTSLTYVKPGILRRWLLRSTLLIINLLSRFWFNRGALGGIPTILSARWVMIDGGRRLLFLDNYSGAWDSYLNEFIDMGAVKGLNAIWANTFVRAPAPERRYAYPETSFYLWRGAQAEPAFKAYVRQSQVETLVWYSAYPTLSITNVNANTKLRQSLFEPLATCDIDAVIQRL